MSQPALRLVEGIHGQNKALDAALSQIERAFGRARSCGSARTRRRSRSRPCRPARSASTSRSASAACRGGRRRDLRPGILGQDHLALHTVAEAQKKGGVCAFIDAEHALDPVYARKLGVNLDDLLISQPDTGEQALEITDTLVRSGAIDVLVIDSVAALTPPRRDRGRDGRRAARHAGPPDEPSPAQAHRVRSRARSSMVIFIDLQSA